MAGRNTCFKNKYTKAEVEACCDWFMQHMDELPSSLTIDPSLRIPNLPFTVRQIMSHLQDRVPNLTVYNGQFSILLLIKDKLSNK